MQCQELLRGLTGVNFVAFDLVAVMPAYDVGGTTCLLEANLAYEMLSLIAWQKKSQAAVLYQFSG